MASVNVTLERQSFFADVPELYELRGVQTRSHVFTAQTEGEYRVVAVADRFCLARPTHPPRPPGAARRAT
jgi:hypothetical protein